MERKVRGEIAPQKKKMIAFKSTPTISDEDDEEEDQEDLSLLVKNVRRMHNKPNSIIEELARKGGEKDHLLQLPEA